MAATDRPQSASSAAHMVIGLAILALAAVLILSRLGHYALWDDEASTALAAIAVWRTGDTTAVIDHNIAAYDGGAQLSGLRRVHPPLPSYLAAPFIGLISNSALPARLPFAIAGMACFVILVWWLWKEQASLLNWGLFGIALICNVSLFLYFRQARYYSLSILCSVTLVYLYLHWGGRRRVLFMFAAVSLCLWASNSLNYVALYACVAADYLLWGHKSRPLKWRDWLTVFLPQIVVGTPLAFIWNPLRLVPTRYQPHDILADKLILFWWNLRDLDRSEFGVTLLMLVAPLLYLLRRETWLLRAAVALLVYILVITFFSPQRVGLTRIADVRFLVPLIPLCIFLGATAVRTICLGKWWLAIPLAIVAFGTNALQIYPFFNGHWRSTILLYVRELRNPPNDPYKETAKWINAHVKEQQTIWVQPGYMIYPLMYHAPKALYAWQLAYPPEPQFQHLDPIHFRGLVPPDYVIVFGPVVRGIAAPLDNLSLLGIPYSYVEQLDIFWRYLYRPELVWRTFKPITNFDPNSEAIYIFKRSMPAVQPPKPAYPPRSP